MHPLCYRQFILQERHQITIVKYILQGDGLRRFLEYSEDKLFDLLSSPVTDEEEVLLANSK